MNASAPRAANSSRLEPRPVALAALASAAAAAVVARWTTPYMSAATFAYLLLVAGVMSRSRKGVHVPLMASGVLIDLALVAILAIKRSAIGTAVGGELTTIQLGHVLASSVAVALYVPAVALGLRAYIRPAAARRALHGHFGRAAFLFRTVGFILMFSLLELVKRVPETLR